jgi:hypothetical protein
MHRRIFLKSTAATLSLPFLEAFSDTKKSNAVKRVLWFYLPNGIVPEKWFPEKTGNGYEMTQSLQPLKKFKNEISVISGLDRTFAPGTDVHAQCGCCWLTSAKPSERTDGPFPLSTSLDQVIASKLPRVTPFSSLALSCNSDKNNIETKHFDSVSWYGPGYAVGSFKSPLLLFNKLFRAKTNFNSSVLDLILEDAKALNSKVSKHDREKIDEYFSSVRDLEKEALLLSAKQDQLDKVVISKKELEPVKRSQYMKIMGKLAVLSMKLDLSRIITIMAGPERWGTPLNFDGVFEKGIVHHSMTHSKKLQDDVAKIDHFYVQQFSYILEEMKKTKDAEGRSLYDNTLSIMGSGIGYGFDHRYNRLPIVLAGNKTNLGGKHTKFEQGTPLANLWLSVADYMGVNLKNYADSTGRISLGI